MAADVVFNDEFSDYEGYLGPKYLEESHGIYVEQLLSILADQRCRNIALTGAYGTGKSSVIRGLEAALTVNRDATEKKIWTFLHGRRRERKASKVLSSRKKIAKSVEGLREGIDDCRKKKPLLTGSKENTQANPTADFSKKLSELESNVRMLDTSVEELLTEESYQSGRAMKIPPRDWLPQKPILVSLAPFDLENLGDNEELENRLQREIVKQLIFREDPLRMEKSSLRQIPVIPWWRKRLNNLFFAFLALGLFLLIGQYETISNWIVTGNKPEGDGFQVTSFLGLGFSFFLIFFLLGHVILERPRIKGVSAGPAQLELDDGEHSYFDKYLTELIYYFQVSETDLVIFEDLDRFKNPGIFEALKELNQQLNFALNGEAKKRINKGKDTVIRFIYAVRDSIFADSHESCESSSPVGENDTERTGVAESEGGTSSANKSGRPFMGVSKRMTASYMSSEAARSRTKFFDAIVPVVPFSSKRNAVDLLTNLITISDTGLKDNPLWIEHSQVIQIIAAHAVDYRVMRDITIEFRVFEEVISQQSALGKSRISTLRDRERLLAMVAYKVFELEDFEKIAYGTSKLDSLFSQINLEFLEIQQRIAKRVAEVNEEKQNLGITKERAKELDRKLCMQLAIFEDIPDPEIIYQGRLSIGNEHFDAGDAGFQEFWIKILGENFLHLSDITWMPQTSSAYGQVNQEKVSKGTIAQILRSAQLSRNQVREWKRRHQFDALLLAKLARIIRDGSLSEFLYKSETQIENDVVSEGRKKVLEIVKGGVSTEIAYQLILSGYIDQEFRFYTSTLNESYQTVEALVFMTMNVERCVPRPNFELGEEALEEVTRRLISDFTGRNWAGALNSDLLVYLASFQESSYEKRYKYLRRSILEAAKTLPDTRGAVNSVIAGIFKEGIKGAKSNPGKDEDIRELLFSEIYRSFPDVLNDDLFSQLWGTTKFEVCDYLLKSVRLTHLFISDRLRELISRSGNKLRVLREGSNPEQAVRAVGELNHNDIMMRSLAGLSRVVTKELLNLGNVQITVPALEEIAAFLGDQPTLVNLESWPGFFEQVIKERRRYAYFLSRERIPSIAEGEKYFPAVHNKVVSYIAAELGRETQQTDRLTAELSILLEQAADGVVAESLKGIDERSYPALALNERISPTIPNILRYVSSNKGKMDLTVQNLLTERKLITKNATYAEVVKLRDMVETSEDWAGNDEGCKQLIEYLDSVCKEKSENKEDEFIKADEEIERLINFGGE
ncbi:hypothetical protein I6I10_02290 [Corynebacterium glucuronolyticum]|uniref:YobI-like P-loop NTPase domain-containing protein n=1 Tax=Corynebacterium glucuronolyticum TaxID=39791 RepID=A0A7T4JVE0_9CORY|nr:hypothetical protein [Corynebacterium glucuronolyticum]QQB46786.1 hypothetical protein I6I10_02290 [Corynebacterium glucuronolyticum]WKD62379.1 hypothetical protein CGLUCO_00430 [Corynebacterium glucuronolyticum DSM 44120]SMB82000.1 hypothetical protein SAMN05660745_02536 [Corynebacterium glucuronolyticum]